MNARSSIYAVILSGFLALLATPAAASEEYPEIIQQELDMKCVPSCTICHDNSGGGGGTAIKPFARAMRDETFDALCASDLACVGGVCRDQPGAPELGTQQLGEACSPPFVGEAPETLPSALRVLEDLGVDSDGDGPSDIEELRESRDPNTPGRGNLCADYGCGARVEPRARLDAWGFVAAALSALLLGAAYRRRTKARR